MSVRWHRCFHSEILAKWAKLEADEILIWTACIMRMQEENGPIDDTPRILARRVSLSEKRASKALASLVDRGEFHRVEGRLFSDFVASEIQHRESVSEARREAGAAKKGFRAELPSGGGRVETIDENINDFNETTEQLQSACSANAPQMPSEPKNLESKNKDSPLPPEGEAAELPLGLDEGSAKPASKPKRRRRKLIGEDDPLFMEFRNAFPARPGPAWDEGLKSWNRTLGEGVEPATLIAAAKVFSKHQHSIGKAGTEYSPMASTWLNQKRWKDWMPKVQNPPNSPRGIPARPCGWPQGIPCGPEQAYRLWCASAWPSSFGPSPGYPGCEVPAEIQQEWIERRNREASEPKSLALQTH